jgi:hypothetical protein
MGKERGAYKPKMKAFEFFTPKRIILNAIKDKLEGQGICKLILVFNVLTDKYNIMLSKFDKTGIKIDLDDNEVNMIKKIFINKIFSKYKEKHDKEVKDIIIEINFESNELNIFIQDTKNEVEKFDY